MFSGLGFRNQESRTGVGALNRFIREVVEFG